MQIFKHNQLSRGLFTVFSIATGVIYVPFLMFMLNIQTSFKLPVTIFSILSLLICFFAPRVIYLTLVAVHCLCLLCMGFIFFLVTCVGGQYELVRGSYAESFYAIPQKVMFIVAHQDDELNMAAGVIDSYQAADAEIKIVFLSNGDAELKNAYRLQEALRCQEEIGLAPDDVIFMGYGDQHTGDSGHLYNAGNGEVVTSKAGMTRTYGLKNHPDYRTQISGDASDYTRENLVRDMQELLNTEQPDVIYCIDYDSHSDHRATSLVFEEALANLLKEGNTYQPIVYKGFGYSTAWESADTYYQSNNVASALMPYESGRMEETNCYLWKDRLRLPVNPQILAYTKRASKLYPCFYDYASQYVIERFGSVIHSDKSFWRRRTDSLLYTATFSALNHENLWRLNDFKLADSNQIANLDYPPFDGVWIPDTEDILRVQLKTTELINEIVLYDNPSLEDNILEACITLQDGTKLLTGRLEPGGVGTGIVLEKPSMLSSFTVEILKTEGEKAGLCELEAYSGVVKEPEFIKITDEYDNFIYTYTPSGTGDIKLKLYASGTMLNEMLTDLESNFNAEIDGKPLKIKDGAFILPRPDKKAVVRVSLASNKTIYDEIVVKPYSDMRQTWLRILRHLDWICCRYSSWKGILISKIQQRYFPA